MKITFKSLTRLNDVRIGGVFMYNSEVFMKTPLAQWHDKTYNVINLSTGYHDTISCDMMVQLCDAELVINSVIKR